ncbi:predicted protein [Naegleria gruberi]|uniref:Predicted protein n=1 Tax=Naegleria gruberi TaxID=5762 RepID=D2W265_NAEGR|nr:uncharacterized protein NAEGRDRAFT_54122 [Naegleria gruberi]EFC36768.1 predicted protein [Naegleria gruberi]|eukprot:XP_002669512.1 predicted protein [Naegleria gruberi strain NEG-M]
MSLRDTLLEQIRSRRTLVEQGEKSILETPIFHGITSNGLMVHFTQFFNNDLCSDFKLILKRKDPSQVNELDAYGNRKLNVIYAHKFVLAQSEWFRTIFESNMMEQLTNELIVDENEENLDTFTAMIAMMYGNYVPSFSSLNSTLVIDLLVCFDKYQATQLFDRVIAGLVKNLARDTPNYRSVNLLHIFSMFGDRTKSKELHASILTLLVTPLWTKGVRVLRPEVFSNDEFMDFFNKQDFNSCYFFLEEFVRATHAFDLICQSIDNWIKFDEADRFDKGFLLYRVALNAHKLIR